MVVKVAGTQAAKEAELLGNPVVKPADVAGIISAVREADPKLVVLLGKHEPLEPTSRLVGAKVDGKPLHAHYSKNEILFVQLPESHTPYGFRKRHAEFLSKLADAVEHGKARITPNPEVDRAFAKAVRDAFSGKGTNLPELFAQNLVERMPRERVFEEVNAARDMILRMAIKDGIVPPTEQMVCEEVGKALGKKVDVISLHFDTGFMSKISEFASGKSYEIAELRRGTDYSYMTVEFGSGGISKQSVAQGGKESRAIEISANWEEAPERMFASCRSETDDGRIAVASQVGSKQFYLEKAGEVEQGRLEQEARDLKALLDRVIAGK